MAYTDEKFWAIAKDFPPCGECVHFDPRWTRGWAAHGRIYKSKLREGECTRYGLVVREGHRDDSGCFEKRD